METVLGTLQMILAIVVFCLFRYSLEKLSLVVEKRRHKWEERKRENSSRL